MTCRLEACAPSLAAPSPGLESSEWRDFPLGTRASSLRSWPNEPFAIVRCPGDCQMHDCRPDYTIAPEILNLVTEIVEEIERYAGAPDPSDVDRRFVRRGNPIS